MSAVVGQQSISPVGGGFFVAAFSAFGHFEGIGRWEYQSLSEKWTNLCGELLDNKGAVFDYIWSGNLSHVRTKFTSAQGVGICTVFIGSMTASSILMMSGNDREAEAEVSKMYIESLENSLPKDMLNAPENDLSKIHSISDRPIMVVVPFLSREISEQDQEIVRELGWHFASAFLQRQSCN